MEEFYISISQHGFQFADGHFPISLTLSVVLCHRHSEGAPCCVWNSSIFLQFETVRIKLTNQGRCCCSDQHLWSGFLLFLTWMVFMWHELPNAQAGVTFHFRSEQRELWVWRSRASTTSYNTRGAEKEQRLSCCWHGFVSVSHMHRLLKMSICFVWPRLKGFLWS